MTIFLLCIAAWYLIGYGFFVYWWTSEGDLDVGAAIVGMFGALSGPFAYFIGRSIHGDGTHKPLSEIVLLRKRER